MYSGKNVLPARFTELEVLVLNTDRRTQVLKKETSLGKLEKAEVIEQNTEVPTASETPSDNNIDIVQLMMDGLPEESTEAQRAEVRKLLQDNEAIFSKGEYDIGRTPLVECRMDTGDHKPIRQPLRRQPFEYLKVIDKQVADMTEHGTVEPAASPWAGNVVLVRKKDNTLRFCVDYRQLNRISKEDSYPLRQLSTAAHRQLLECFTGFGMVQYVRPSGRLSQHPHSRSGQRQNSLCHPRWMSSFYSHVIRLDWGTQCISTTDGLCPMWTIVYYVSRLS